MVWPMIAAAAASAIAGAVGSKSAADAQSRASRNAIQEQRRQFDTIMGLQQPWMVTGTGALNQLASLYGLPYQSYQSPAQYAAMQPTTAGAAASSGGSALMPGGSAVHNFVDPLRLANGGKGANVMNILDGAGLFGFGGDSNAPYTANINTQTGTVDVKGGHNALDAAMTNYLRTGQDAPTGGHGRYSDIKRQIEAIRAQGYTFDPATGQGSMGQAPGTTGSAGQAPSGMAGFVASPDYQFRLSEGQRNMGNSFAARGGAASGNALRALTEFNQNMASSEYGNYVNRLMSLAGLGQTATNQTSNYAYGTGNNVGNLMQSSGDSRASGIAGMTGSLIGGLNMLGSYFGGRSGGGTSLQPIDVYSNYMTSGFNPNYSLTG